MTIFKSNPAKALHRGIEAATANGVKLSARLSDAEAAVVDAALIAQQLAIDGVGDAELNVAEAKVRALTDRASTLKSAIARNETDIAALERERSDLADKMSRRETAADIAELAVGIENIAKELDPVLGKLAELAGRATKYHIYVEQGLVNFAVSSRAQIPDATTLLASVLRGHANAVLNGFKAVPQPVQPAPLVATSATAD